MLRRIVAYLEILRPHNMLAATFAVFAGYHAAGGRGVDGIAWLAALCALATGGGNVANDAFDDAIDRINKPRRPIPSGRISIKSALAWYGVLSLATALLAWMVLPRNLALVVMAWQVSLFLYARWLKRSWPWGNIAVAAIAASALWGGALAVGNARAAVIPMAIAFAFVACRELVKGAEDVDGDRAAGAHTLATAVGKDAAARAAAAAMLAVAMLMPLPSVAGIYGPAYAVVMLAAVVPALTAGAVTVARSRDKHAFARTSQWLKLAMFAGLWAIVAGT